MSSNKGYYSLIQYCPDLLRLEAANVGVLLFCPERHFLKARMSPKNKRIRKFFGGEGFDLKQIKLFKKGVEDRLRNESNNIGSLADLERFIALRANQLQFTPPRPIKVTCPQRDLDDLFRDVIGDEVSNHRQNTLRSRLNRVFDQPDIASRLHKDLSVTVPILEIKKKIPYGFQNGHFNLITSVEFNPEPEKSVQVTSRIALEGEYLFKNQNAEFGETQLFVVGEFSDQNRTTEQRVRRIFEDHNVKLFRSDELSNLVEEIRTTGKEIHS